MTNREKEALKKIYQRKCINEKIAIKSNSELQTILGVLHACMAILEVGKREGSSRALIDEWEAEVGFSVSMVPEDIH